MMGASRVKPAKVTEVMTARDQGMIAMVATDIVQEVQNEVDVGANMRIAAGSRGTRKRKKHGGTGDGRDRGRWMLGMTEMKSDVEWIDPLVGIRIIPSISSLPVCRACADPMLIKIGLLSARWGLVVVVHSMVGTSSGMWCCIGAH